MKRSFLGLAFVLAGAPHLMYGALVNQLTLNANSGGAICVVNVDTGNIVTTNGSTATTCGNLDINSTADHGTIQVSTKVGKTFGGFTISSSSFLGFAANAGGVIQSSGEVTVKSASAGTTLSALYADTDLTFPAAQFGITLSGGTHTPTTANSGTVDYKSLIDACNCIPVGTPFATFTGETGGPGGSYADGGVFANPIAGTTPYSLGVNVVINYTRTGSITANYQISNIDVPEPASIILTGSMLLLTGFGIRRKMMKKA